MGKIWLFRIVGWGAVFSLLGHFAWYYDVDYYAKNYEVIPLFFKAKMGNGNAQVNLARIHWIGTVIHDEDEPMYCQRYQHSIYWYEKAFKTLRHEISSDEILNYKKEMNYEWFRQEYRARCKVDV